jgi:copper chaperone
VPTRPRPRASVPAGVESFDVNLESQKVMVKGTVTQQQVIDVIAKTGKAVEPWSD